LLRITLIMVISNFKRHF